jgi:hypothetical protein
MGVKIQLLRGSSSDWSTKNPILDAGQPGFEIDTYKLKIGNGVLAWNDLPYITGGFGGDNGPLEYIYDIDMSSDDNITPSLLTFDSRSNYIDYSNFYNYIIDNNNTVSLKLTSKNNSDNFFIAAGGAPTKQLNTGSIAAFWPSSSIQWIIDGGDDQYDSANFINNNITTSSIPTSSPSSSVLRSTSIPYNSGRVSLNSQYWNSNDYVTLYKKNIFAMVAKGNATTMPNTVYYAGNAGADGDGDKDIGSLSNYNGYQAGYCRLWGDDPTYTKLIISKVGTVPTYSTDPSNDTNDDLFVASGLNSDTIAMVVFYAADTTNPSSLSDIQLLFESFIDNVLTGATNINNIETNFYSTIDSVYSSVDSSFWYDNFEFFTGTNEGDPNLINAEDGSGSNLQFSVTVNQDTREYDISISNAGEDYQSGDIIVLRGNNLSSPNGRSPDEDIYMEITSVDTGGEVLSFNTIISFNYIFSIDQILARADGFRFNDNETYYLNIDLSGGIDTDVINDLIYDAFNTNLIAGTGVFLDYDSGDNTLTINNLHTEINVLSQEPQGFVNRLDSIISFNDLDRTFTIAPAGSSYDIYIEGVKVTKTATETVVIGSGTALNYLHFNTDTGLLENKTTPFNFDTDVPIAYIHWNADINQSTFFGEERHGIRMDSVTHKWIHDTFGIQYIDGLSIGNYVLSGDGTSNSHAQISISNGTLYQEDIVISIADGDNGVEFTQQLDPIAYIPTYYHSGSTGQWVRDIATAYPLKYNGTRAQYNLLSGSTWTTPNVTNNRYFAMWIVATNDMIDPILAIVGQREDSSLGSAENLNNWTDLNLANIPANEIKPLYRLIFVTNNTFTNTPKSSLQSILDLRGSILSTVNGVTQNDHGLLFGLGDDDHSQYVHIDNARTIDAIHTATNGLYIGSSNANTITKILKKNTTDNTANVVLTTNGGAAGGGNRLVIPASTTWNFIIQLVAHNDTDHTAASWVFRGCLRRNNSNATSLIESVISENWSEGDMSSTIASVVADDTNEALELRVTGLSSTNIRWVAAVNITQSIL